MQRFATELVDSIKFKNIPVYPVFWNKEEGLIKSYFKLWKTFLQLITIVNIIHFVVLTPYNIPFIITAQLLRKKILITYHGNYILETPLKIRPHFFLPFWISDKISRNASNAIVSPSKYLMDQLRISEDKCVIIPNPAKIKTRKKNKAGLVRTYSNDLIIVTASNFNISEKVNALYYFFEAIVEVSKKYPSICVYTFGNGKHLSRFKKRYASNKNLFFMGFRTDFRDYLNEADIYAHISGLDNQPYAVVDALLEGKVILFNENDGLKEMLIAENNYMVILDKNSIYNTILSVISDIKINKRIFLAKGNKNQEFAEQRYSTEMISKKYVEVYSDILNSR